MNVNDNKGLPQTPLFSLKCLEIYANFFTAKFVMLNICICHQQVALLLCHRFIHNATQFTAQLGLQTFNL